MSSERLFVAARTGCLPGLSRNFSSLVALEGKPIIVFPQGGRPSFADQVLELLRRASVCPSNVETAEDVFAAIAMTMISDSICIIPESVANLHWPELDCAVIDDPVAVSPLNCVFLSRGRTAVVDAFLEAIAV